MQTLDRNHFINSKFLSGVFVFGFIALLFMTSCRDDSFYEGELDLTFSVDTLRFDTVFTTLGSATRYVKIFNTQSERIQLSNVMLESGENSFFRMNIDGVSGKSIQNVDIPPNDSIYVFVEVTIDPDNPLSISPFIIMDRILINGDVDKNFIRLEAWGQNANYIPSSNGAGGIYGLPCPLGEVTWDDPKPYVIYGILLVDECKLTWPPGTQIYVHGGVVNNEFGIYSDGIILIGENGRLEANGTAQDTIVLQGDRLEEPFQDDAGQWQGLRFLPESTGNKLSYTTIKNSLFGLFVDSLANVNIDHSKFYNTSSVGVYGYHSTINMTNSLVHSSNGHALLCTYGGNYNLDYCTLASYGNDKEVAYISNYICRPPLCSSVDVNPLNITIDNSILTGSQNDELFLDDISEGDISLYNYQFRNCIVRVDTLLSNPIFVNFFDRCDNCININTASNDTLFVNLDVQDYHLDTMSVAEGKGIPLNGILDDIEGNVRDNSAPDIGCYEFQM